MNRTRAALGSLLFLGVAPGTVAGLVPWWITRWDVDGGAGAWFTVPAGMLLVAGGTAVLLSGFVRFAVEGRGTPAPVAPTETLVTGGLYRSVRNPMYVAVITVLCGQVLLFRSAALLLWTLAAGAAMVAFVRLHEEPALLRRHGASYAAYRETVPGWLPRVPRR